METKKTKKADLSSRKSVYFNLGLVLAMAFIISAFEYKSYGDVTVPELPDPFEPWEATINIPITKQNIPRPPKPKLEKIVNPKIVLDDSPDLTDYKVKPTLDIETVVDFPSTDLLPPEPVEKPPFHFIVEEMPEFPGGQKAFMKFISKNVKYPRHAKNMDMEGKVFVEFIIDETGKVTNVKTIKGIGAGCDKEAVRVLEKSPLWSPGKQRYVPVKVKMVVPIIFKLNN